MFVDGEMKDEHDERVVGVVVVEKVVVEKGAEVRWHRDLQRGQ